MRLRSFCCVLAASCLVAGGVVSAGCGNGSYIPIPVYEAGTHDVFIQPPPDTGAAEGAVEAASDAPLADAPADGGASDGPQLDAPADAVDDGNGKRDH